MFERLDIHVSDGIYFSVETIRACDRAGELMFTCRNAARNNLNDNAHHLRLIISDKKKCISDFQSRLETMN